MNHSKLKIRNSTSALRAFTLVELIIVVSILGILAAIVLPEFQGHVQQAKESAAKDNLRLLRGAIERYALEHNGVPPGYPNDDQSQTPSGTIFGLQIKNHGYFSDDVLNPFNDSRSIIIILDGQSFPDPPTGTSGWYYKPSAKQLRLNWPGTDSEGTAYSSY